MKHPYTISAKTRTYKGKKIKFFQYSINESSGLPSFICQEHHRKTIKARNKTEAQALIIDLIKNLEEEFGNQDSKETFAHYTRNYMIDGKCKYQSYKNSEGSSLAASYMKEYRALYVNHVESDHILCSKKIASINRGDLLRYRERLVEKIGVTATSRKALKIVKQNLKYAAMMGDIPYDPSAGMSDIKDAVKVRGILTMDEIRDIFPTGGLGPWKDDQDYLAFFIAYSCGLRKGEVLGLRWKNVDLDKEIIFIEEALVDIEHRLGDPKKGKKRWCPLPGRTVLLLKNWKSKTKFRDNDSYVFCFQRRYRDCLAGTHFSGSWWRTRFSSAMKKANIDCKSRNIVPHSLRHSVNTHLQDKGYSKEKIRETLGWSSISVQSIYTHGDMMDHSEQAILLDSILSKQSE